MNPIEARLRPAALQRRAPAAEGTIAHQLAANNRAALAGLAERRGIPFHPWQTKLGHGRIRLEIKTQADLDSLETFFKSRPNVLQLVATNGPRKAKPLALVPHLRAIFRGEGVHVGRWHVNPRDPGNTSGLSRVNRMFRWGTKGSLDLSRSDAFSVFIQLSPEEGSILANRLAAAWDEQGPLPASEEHLMSRVMNDAFLRGPALGANPAVQDCTRTWRNVLVGTHEERLLELVGLDKSHGHGGGGSFMREIEELGNGRVIGAFRAHLEGQ